MHDGVYVLYVYMYVCIYVCMYACMYACLSPRILSNPQYNTLDRMTPNTCYIMKIE